MWYYYIKGVDLVKEAYLKTLKTIKQLNIKTEGEYRELLQDYLILSMESLKYITQKKKFKDIIKLAEEAE